MFGLTESEMDLYKDLSQDFAVRDVAPMVVKNAKFMTHIITHNGKKQPDAAYVNQIATDVETIITLTATHMAYEYAYLQFSSEKSEVDILKDLHDKYDSYLFSQFIKYGITFTSEVFAEIIGAILLELPFIYLSVIEGEDFEDQGIMEDKIKAYDQYLRDNFPEEEDIEEEEED